MGEVILQILSTLCCLTPHYIMHYHTLLSTASATEREIIIFIILNQFSLVSLFKIETIYFFK